MTEYSPKGIGLMEEFWKNARALRNNATMQNDTSGNTCANVGSQGSSFAANIRSPASSRISRVSRQDWSSNPMAASTSSGLQGMLRARAGSSPTVIACCGSEMTMYFCKQTLCSVKSCEA